MEMRSHKKAVPHASRLEKIKLVVSDLDGTLLDENSRLPSEFSQFVQKLEKKNIQFATASGRNWESQKDLFTAYKEQLTFICDNGAFIMHKGKLFFISELDTELWKNIARKCFDYGPECGAIVCGVKGTYMIQNPALKSAVGRFYPELNYINDFDEIDDQIFKVSVCYLKGTAGELFEDFYRCFSEQANLVCAHPLFMDVMNSGINKASGVALLQQALGLTSEQTMAFGDYDNDIEMLENAGLAYVMENAPLSMRKYTPFHAPSNEKQGVIRVLENTLL